MQTQEVYEILLVTSKKSHYLCVTSFPLVALDSGPSHKYEACIRRSHLPQRPPTWFLGTRSECDGCQRQPCKRGPSQSISCGQEWASRPGFIKVQKELESPLRFYQHGSYDPWSLGAKESAVINKKTEPLTWTHRFTETINTG